MKRAIYVDYENVSLHGLEAIEKLTGDDYVKIFIGAQSTRLSMVDANRIFNCEAHVELITNKYIGKNALDFIIMVYMGYDIAKGLAGAYFVVSNDKGYDPAIYQMRKLSGLTVLRKSDISFVLREKIKDGAVEADLPEEKTALGETTEKNEKKSVGKRFLGLFGFGKEKPEEKAEEAEIEEESTERLIVEKNSSDSNVREKILSELVDDGSTPEKKNYRGRGSYNRNRTRSYKKNSNEVKPEKVKAEKEKPEKKKSEKARLEGEKQQKAKPVKNKPEKTETVKPEAERKEPEKAKQKKTKPVKVKSEKTQAEEQIVKETDIQSAENKAPASEKSEGRKQNRRRRNNRKADNPDKNNVAVSETKTETAETETEKNDKTAKPGRRRVVRKTTTGRPEEEKKEEKPVIKKTPEELERERQRNEAFELLATLNEEEEQNNKPVYKRK